MTVRGGGADCWNGVASGAAGPEGAGEDDADEDEDGPTSYCGA